MGTSGRALVLGLITVCCVLFRCSSTSLWESNALLVVNASHNSTRKMPESLFGIFFEEINHAGAGGLWAELVSNRGFESGGQHSPSIIDPWSIIGDDSLLRVSTDFSSCFKRNPIALRMEVLCDNAGSNVCPVGGVAVRDRSIGKTSLGFGLRVDNVREASYERADPNFVMLTPNKEHLAEGIHWKVGKRPMLQSDVNSGNFEGVPRELRPLGRIL